MLTKLSRTGESYGKEQGNWIPGKLCTHEPHHAIDLRLECEQRPLELQRSGREDQVCSTC